MTPETADHQDTRINLHIVGGGEISRAVSAVGVQGDVHCSDGHRMVSHDFEEGMRRHLRTTLDRGIVQDVHGIQRWVSVAMREGLEMLNGNGALLARTQEDLRRQAALAGALLADMQFSQSKRIEA
ncbi:MAG: hypothetical protein PHS73_01475 [Candidatus Peribacteraceae bacterium]|nr:hypothetical protein [Candidatus Peribacteraceae bacterium]